MTRRSADFESNPEGLGIAKPETYSMPENPKPGLLGHSFGHSKSSNLRQAKAPWLAFFFWLPTSEERPCRASWPAGCRCRPSKGNNIFGKIKV